LNSNFHKISSLDPQTLPLDKGKSGLEVSQYPSDFSAALNSPINFYPKSSPSPDYYSVPYLVSILTDTPVKSS